MLSVSWALFAALLFVFDVSATVISAGTPTTSVPAAVVDDLATLSDPLPADEFLLPIEIAGASGLQDWAFDLLFDPAVVQPLDAGGLYQSVYSARFNASDPTPSGITSSGFSFPTGALTGIAGFSFGATGDGQIAFVLFSFQPDRPSDDAQFAIDNVTLQQAPEQRVPEPATALLVSLAGCIALRCAVRRRGEAAASYRPLRAGR